MKTEQKYKTNAVIQAIASEKAIKRINKIILKDPTLIVQFVHDTFIIKKKK